MYVKDVDLSLKVESYCVSVGQTVYVVLCNQWGVRCFVGLMGESYFV